MSPTDRKPSKALISSAPSTVFGQSVTFTATVTATGGGSGTATGAVVFSSGANVLGSVNLNGSGQAALTLSTLGVASYTVVATYQGDANFKTSASSSVPFTVNKSPSSSTLASSPNPAVFGQSASFTVTVVPSGAGAGSPSGTVTFLDNGSTIGNVPLGGTASATLSLSSL